MAKVPSLPSNGQPIDTEYIYQIVDSLISINGELASTGTSQVQTYTNQPISNKTNNFKIQARVINAVNAATVTKASSTTGQIAFNTQFSNTPVVTASLISRSSSTVRSRLTITGVDTSAVYYKIDYEDQGNVTLDVSIIAVGV